MLFKKQAGFRNLAVLFILACSLARAQGGGELAGLAVYTDTARDIYIAGLQTADGKPPADAANPLAPMTMEYRVATRRISSRGFSGTLLLQAELGAGHRASEAVIDVLGELKQQIQGSLLSGDQFEVVLTDDGDTLFRLNGIELLRDSGEEVFSYLFQGWIGDSSSALFREKLLSGSLDESVRLRYESLIPLNERVELVAAWVEDADEQDEPGAAEVKEQQVATAAAAPTKKAPEPAAKKQPAKNAAGVTAAAVAVNTSATATKKSSAPAPKQAVPAAQKKPDAEKKPAVQKDSSAGEEQLAAASGPAPDAPAADGLANLDDREYQLQLNAYVRAVMTKVFKNVRYPRRAVSREIEGQVEVLAELNVQGELLTVSLETSSGHDSLDKAAIKAVEKATPFPELNFVAREEFAADSGEGYLMLIPVKFMLN